MSAGPKVVSQIRLQLAPGQLLPEIDLNDFEL